MKKQILSAVFIVLFTFGSFSVHSFSVNNYPVASSCGTTFYVNLSLYGDTRSLGRHLMTQNRFICGGVWDIEVGIPHTSLPTPMKSAW